MTLDYADVKRYRAILKVRAKMLESTRFWLGAQEFTEVQAPLLVPIIEGKASFEVSYGNRKMDLSGRLQPYSDRFLEMFNKIYTVSPTFRPEHDTDRHLIEFWRVEVSALNFTFEKIMDFQEKMISFVCSKLLEDVSEELLFLNGSSLVETLKLVKPPFCRLTYDEAINRLQKLGFKVFWGETIDWSQESELSKTFTKPFFITEFPLNGENYFHKPVFRKPELTLSCDLIAPGGYGEIASGGEMLRQKNVVINKLKELEISPEAQKWYLDLRRFGSVPQAGFALGVERALQWICRLESIKQVSLFRLK